MIKKLLLLTLFSLLFFQFCTSNFGKRKIPEKLLIVTTTGMIGDMVKNIADDSSTVISLMGPGVDPHLFKASQKDIGKLADADIIFYNGLHLEGKMTEILKKISRYKSAIPVSDGLKKSRLRPLTESAEQFDPHIWFDVSLWIEAAKFVGDQLANIDTAHAPIYQLKTARYIEQLENLHTAIKQKINTIPETQRILVTAHDAFGYFGDAYGIRVLGLQGISTVAEFGVNDVTKLVDVIVANKVPAIFVESSIPTRSIEAIIAGCKARDANVKIGGTLYSDAMGQPGSGADTYIKMVSHNVNIITDGLK